MKMQKKKLFKMKKTTKQYIIVAIICICVMGGAAALTTVMMYGNLKSKYESKLADANELITSNQRLVFVTTTDINAGDSITSDNVEQKVVFASQGQETYVTGEDIGKTLLVDVAGGTQLTKGMLTDQQVSAELREMQYDVINVNANILGNDTVDVRIVYPNGESYVVISKKVIKGVQPESTTCYFWLSEDELLNMSAAIVDAGLYQGSRLITAKYIEPSIQEASQVTYTPSLQVMSLIESNPNIIEQFSQVLSEEVRKSLENRLAASMKVDVTTAAWDVSNYEYNQTQQEESQDDSTLEEEIEEPIIATPTPEPETEQSAIDLGEEEYNAEQSRDDYMFYTEEEEVREGDVEYGE